MVIKIDGQVGLKICYLPPKGISQRNPGKLIKKNTRGKRRGETIREEEPRSGFESINQFKPHP